MERGLVRHLRETVARLRVGRAVPFMAAVVVRQSAGVLLLALLVVVLTPAEFTRYGLLTSLFAVAVPLVSLNIQHAPARLYFDCHSLVERRDLLVSTLAASLTSAVITGFAWVVGLLIASWNDPITEGASSLQVTIAMTIVALVAVQFGATLFRVLGSGRDFLALAAVSALGIPVAFAILASGSDDYVRLLIGVHLATAVTGVGVVMATGRSHLKGGRVRAEHVRSAASYAWPIVIHSVAFWAVTNSGRWIGAAELPLDTLAGYTLVTQVIVVLGGYSRAAFDARVPEIARLFAAGDDLAGRRAVTLISATTVSVHLVLYSLLALVFGTVGHRVRPEYVLPLPLLGLSFLVSLLDSAYLRGVQYSKRTAHLAAGTVVAGLVTVGVSWLLVRRAGATGLLVALAFGMATQAGVINLIAALGRREVERGR
jgi:O-antigen/teichoic acid export membrane protein